MAPGLCGIPVEKAAELPSWVVPLGAAFLGAVFAFASRGVYDRWVSAATARRLALALWEELSAVEFGPSPPPATPMFAGFSSQVFDSLFADLARCLPEHLFRAVARYHWKMKFIEDSVGSRQAALGPASGSMAWVNVAEHVVAAEGQRAELLARLDVYGKLSTTRLFIARRERLLRRG